jgi:hypothetical protein
MRRLIKILFFLNYAFWSILFLWSFILFIGYNGLFNLFTFSCQIGNDLNIHKMNNNYVVGYSYSNGEERFYSSERVSSEIYDMKIRDQKDLEICYNSQFPQLSYLKNLNLPIYKNKISIVISLFFLLFFFVIDLFVNKVFWINKYEIFFKKT